MRIHKKSTKQFFSTNLVGDCPSCKANLSPPKLLGENTVFQCSSCRIGLQLKKDPLFRDLVFYAFCLSLIALIYLYNLSLWYYLLAGLWFPYSLFKRKKWRAVTKGEMCPDCHYDLYGSKNASVCPECGKELIRSRH